MSTAELDLDAYFQRIGYNGKLSPDLETVRALVARHTESIPFENINPFLGFPVNIDLPSIQQKLVREKRGGYCYEQNALFRRVLETIGIPVTGLAARVLWQAAEGVRPAQSHMMLRADIQGTPYLLDVGFGGNTPTAPLRLDTERKQHTSHGSYRLLERNGEYLVEIGSDKGWLPIYSFDLQEQSAGDYKIFNWYCSTHPDSHFVTDLVAARPSVHGRHTLRNNELTFYPRSGDSKHQSRLNSVAELRGTLADIFRIRLPSAPNLEQKLARLIDTDA